MLKLTFFYDVIENIPEFFSIDLHVLAGNVVRISLITTFPIQQVILWVDMLKVLSLVTFQYGIYVLQTKEHSSSSKH